MTFRISNAFAVSLLATFVTLPLQGCSKDDDSSAASASAEQGTWETGCVKDDSDSENIVYSKSVVTLSGSNFSGVSNSFSKAGCAATDATYVVQLESTYTLNGTAMDSTPTKLAITPKSDAQVTEWKSLCTDLTWKKDTATEVKTTSCGDLGKTFFEKDYGLLEIKDGKLYFGKTTQELDGTTAAKRSKELDTDSPYTKK
ncbi:MAG: hypothetical protein IOD12_17545 [Silvanigrellales bacterium]|jgi:hypothetical protein|nr:hypothetical protein [Silvanigrellales bacterium]